MVLTEKLTAPVGGWTARRPVARGIPRISRNRAKQMTRPENLPVQEPPHAG